MAVTVSSFVLALIVEPRFEPFTVLDNVMITSEDIIEGVSDSPEE